MSDVPNKEGRSRAGVGDGESMKAREKLLRNSHKKNLETVKWIQMIKFQGKTYYGWYAYVAALEVSQDVIKWVPGIRAKLRNA